jgi:hypothetical protein
MSFLAFMQCPTSHALFSSMRVGGAGTSQQAQRPVGGSATSCCSAWCHQYSWCALACVGLLIVVPAALCSKVWLKGLLRWGHAGHWDPFSAAVDRRLCLRLLLGMYAAVFGHVNITYHKVDTAFMQEFTVLPRLSTSPMLKFPSSVDISHSSCA